MIATGYTMTENDLREAAERAHEVHQDSAGARHQDSRNLKTEDGVKFHIVGNLGEVAYSRVHGLEINEGFRRFKQPDVGDVHVRAAENSADENRHLPFYPEDVAGWYSFVSWWELPLVHVHWAFYFDGDFVNLPKPWIHNPGRRGDVCYVPHNELVHKLPPTVCSCGLDSMEILMQDPTL